MGGTGLGAGLGLLTSEAIDPELLAQLAAENADALGGDDEMGNDETGGVSDEELEAVLSQLSTEDLMALVQHIDADSEGVEDQIEASIGYDEPEIEQAEAAQLDDIARAASAEEYKEAAYFGMSIPTTMTMTAKTLTYTINGKSGNLLVVIDDKFLPVSTKHPEYASLKQATEDGDVDTFLEIYENYVIDFAGNEKYEIKDPLKIKTDSIEYRGHIIDDPDTIALIKSYGTACDAVKNFIDNLFLNPNWESVKQLTRFLRHGNFPLTTDGCFLGYRAINPDYTDIWTGTMSMFRTTILRIGYRCRAKASEGSWIALIERNTDGEILHAKFAKAGRDIKPDVFYILEDGEFVEQEADNDK